MVRRKAGGAPHFCSASYMRDSALGCGAVHRFLAERSDAPTAADRGEPLRGIPKRRTAHGLQRSAAPLTHLCCQRVCTVLAPIGRCPRLVWKWAYRPHWRREQASWSGLNAELQTPNVHGSPVF